jgi:NAD(P)-dependent dehydrogenase (short-subunit alcohol dehydrogenase family)
MRSGAGALVFPQFRHESRLLTSPNDEKPRVGLSVRGHRESNRDRAELVALRRLGTVEDCAKVVEFLATDLSDYVIGVVIPIDGGLVRG